MHRVPDKLIGLRSLPILTPFLLQSKELASYQERKLWSHGNEFVLQLASSALAAAF